VTAGHWLGSALHCSINWQYSDAAGPSARFLRPIDRLLWCYFLVVARLVRRTESHSKTVLRLRRHVSIARAAYHLSAFIVASVTGPSCWPVWHTVYPLLVAVARPCVCFTGIVTLTSNSIALACRTRQRPAVF
jgi:hypothetical protein